MPVTDLPFDVLDLLCQFVHTPDLPALAASTSLFYPSAQSSLFRRISLYNPSQALRFLSSLERRPDLAHHVRSLSMRLDPNARLLSPFVRLLGKGLANMPNLAYLDVVVPQAASRAFFDAEAHGTSYTRLLHFSCNLPLNHAICSFLQRAPALRELQLGEYAATSPQSTAPPSIPSLPSSALPNLAFYMGPSDAVPVLIPCRPLESVHLYPGDLSEEVLDALSRASSPITVFGAFTHSLSPAILRRLAESLPHLHLLRIMTMYHASNPPDDVSLSAI